MVRHLEAAEWPAAFGQCGVDIGDTPEQARGYLPLVAGHPTLDVETSASNRRLAREDWERPLDFEAYRLGIEPPVGLPISWPRLADQPR